MTLSPEQLQAIEAACERLATGVGQDRVKAEEFIMKLRSSKDALEVARALIDCSTIPAARFQAAIMMREAVLKDWAVVQPAQRNELKGHIIKMVIEGSKDGSMKPFVRSQLLQVFSVIIKRCIFEEDDPDLMGELITYIQSLVTDQQTRAVAMYLTLAVLQEFSSPTRSVAGLPIEFHHSCVVRVNREGHLKSIFVMIISLLHASLDELRDLGTGLAGAVQQSGAFAWLEPCVALTNIIFAWDFSASDSKSGVMGTLGSVTRGEIIIPGPLWRDVLVQPATIDLFYSIYSIARDHEKLAHDVRQCLVDLAGIRGDVFPDDVARQAYFEHTLRCALALLTMKIDEKESVDVALILRRLMTNFPASFLMSSPSAPVHLEKIKNFTCMLMQQAKGFEEVCWQEALDHVVELWSGLRCHINPLPPQMSQLTYKPGEQNLSDAHDSDFLAHSISLMLDARDHGGMLAAVRVYTAQIFREFVEKCMREAVLEVEEWDGWDEEHEDRSIVEDRLTAIGCIGRPLANDSIFLLTDEIARRIQGLSMLAIGGGSAAERELHAVLEQLHWLVKIAGHILADEGEGEVPCIPDQISILSHEAGQAGEDISKDPVACLTNEIVRLVQFQSDCRKGGKQNLTSPLLAESCCWFFTRWTQTYLLPASSECFPVSANLTSLYGTPEGAQGVLTFLITQVHLNLEVWGTEDVVLMATCALVLALAGRRQVGRLLVCTQGWLELSQMLGTQLVRPRTAKVIPSYFLEQVTHALCASVSGLDDQLQKTQLLKGLITPIQQSLEIALAPVKAPDSHWLQNGGGDALLAGISMFQGACKAGDFYTYDVSFELVAPVLASLPLVLEAFGELNDLVGGVVHLYLAIAESQVSFMSASQMAIFNDACLQLLGAFATAEDSASRRTVAGELLQHHREQWLREHLLSLLQLLLHLARKDVADFANEAGTGLMDVADVVLFGLSIVQPLITPETLQHPPLATEFFGLLGWLVETYPQKVSTMPREKLDPMMACLAHGLQQADSDIARVSVEAVDALATYQIGTLQPDASYLLKANHPQMLTFFLQSILETLLFRHFNRGVLEASCDALHSLMWCEQKQFSALMNQVLETQSVSSQREEVQRATITLLSVVSASGPAVQRSAKLQFRKHMRDFLGSVRPFLVKV